MAIMTSDQVKNEELRHQQTVQHPPHGYPVSLITDLFDTVRALRTLKKRHQHVAERRGKVIAQIYSLTSRDISELE